MVYWWLSPVGGRMESACGLSVRTFVCTYGMFTPVLQAREYVLNVVVCLVVCHKSIHEMRDKVNHRVFCYFLLEHCVFERLLHEAESKKYEMINHYYTFHLIAI